MKTSGRQWLSDWISQRCKNKIKSCELSSWDSLIVNLEDSLNWHHLLTSSVLASSSGWHILTLVIVIVSTTQRQLLLSWISKGTTHTPLYPRREEMAEGSWSGQRRHSQSATAKISDFDDSTKACDCAWVGPIPQAVGRHPELLWGVSLWLHRKSASASPQSESPALPCLDTINSRSCCLTSRFNVSPSRRPPE